MEEFDYEMLELETIEELDDAIKNFKTNLSKIKTGRADPTLLDNVKFNYYGELAFVSQMCQISIPEARQLLIKPYDSTSTAEVTLGIKKANLNVEPINEGERIRITFPIMTQETRRKSSKSIGKYKEEAKIAIRNIRQKSMNQIKKSDESDDTKVHLEAEIQKIIVEYNHKIDSTAKHKEEQVMKI